ncbi:hypothetical protein RSSM_05225 [Rhodopirellula sallentina SM41]|uniref:Uncharacterized protein n=1 Tax=Rhodopirellula sallentina SM41 TaxID=1263870 RepID=M5UBG5_9BACT|nr:hypothetical protein RSSM_05225 [Rhodopirellula sallentina SM41]
MPLLNRIRDPADRYPTTGMNAYWLKFRRPDQAQRRSGKFSPAGYASQSLLHPAYSRNLFDD